MLHNLFRFLFLLCLTMAVLYGVHRLLLTTFFPAHSLDFLHFSYKFNLGITLLFTTTIVLASEKLKDQIGFVFLAEGMVKIGLFLYLTQNLGFTIDKSVLIDFFIPYLGCQAVEIFFITKLLKGMNPNNNQ